MQNSFVGEARYERPERVFPLGEGVAAGLGVTCDGTGFTSASPGGEGKPSNGLPSTTGTGCET